MAASILLNPTYYSQGENWAESSKMGVVYFVLALIPKLM
jgi:hypothetical protein